MQIIQKINNNVAVGIDGNQKEIVVFGKGIGFPQMPYELSDLSKINRTFYDVDPNYYELFQEVDIQLLNLIGTMVDIIKTRIKGNWDKNLTFILTDHVNFSIRRTKLGMKMDFPYSYEIEADFPEFNKYAKWMVSNINSKMNVFLDYGEITCIAMHLISAFEGYEKEDKESLGDKTRRILLAVTKIIEQFYNIKVDKNTLDYQRFRYHIQYFIKRKEAKEEIREDNLELYEELKREYPQTYECACRIQTYMEKEFHEKCSKDEVLYLMIHLNRLV